MFKILNVLASILFLPIVKVTVYNLLQEINITESNDTSGNAVNMNIAVENYIILEINWCKSKTIVTG